MSDFKIKRSDGSTHFMSVDELAIAFKLVGMTYPEKTLKRRLTALKDNEVNKVSLLLDKALCALGEAESIIAKRADVNGDSWP